MDNQAYFFNKHIDAGHFTPGYDVTSPQIGTVEYNIEIENLTSDVIITPQVSMNGGVWTDGTPITFTVDGVESSSIDVSGYFRLKMEGTDFDIRVTALGVSGTVSLNTDAGGNLPVAIGEGLSPETSTVGTQTGVRNSTKYTTAGTKLVVTATKGTVLGCMIDGGDLGITVELFAAITAINPIDSISVPATETRMLAFDGLAYTTGLVAVITTAGTVDVSIRWVTG